jgi:hypothetical protein
MKLENLRTLIRESITEYIKEIDEAAEIAANEARINKTLEAIKTRKDKLARIEENEELKEMVDSAKIKDIQNEIKELEKAEKKFRTLAEKRAAKKAKKSAPKDEKEVTTDAPIDETDVMAEMDLEKENTEEALNESFLKMQKLAGVITEAQYNEKKRLNENQLEENYVLDAMGTVLVGGVGLVLATAGVVGGAALAYDNIMYGPIADAIVKLKNKIDSRKFNKYVKPILIRFKDDKELQDMIEKGSTSKEIETYLESKLQPKELKYLEDISNSLWYSNYSKSDELEKI